MYLAGGCENLLILQLPKTSPVIKFPCLLNLPPAHLQKSAFSLSLSLPSTYRGWF